MKLLVRVSVFHYKTIEELLQSYRCLLSLMSHNENNAQCQTVYLTFRAKTYTNSQARVIHYLHKHILSKLYPNPDFKGASNIAKHYCLVKIS